MMMPDKDLNLQNSISQAHHKKREIVRELNKEDFGKYVAELRSKKQNGLTQELLAEKLNISTSYVEKIEGGKRIPSAEILVGMADLLEVPPSELMAVLADLPPKNPKPAAPPDNELVKVVIKAVIEYLKNTDNLQDLQELIGAMTSPYDKHYDAPQPVVEDIAKELGKGREKPVKPRSFKRPDKDKPPAPTKPKKEQVHQDNPD